MIFDTLTMTCHVDSLASDLCVTSDNTVEIDRYANKIKNTLEQSYLGKDIQVVLHQGSGTTSWTMHLNGVQVYSPVYDGSTRTIVMAARWLAIRADSKALAKWLLEEQTPVVCEAVDYGRWLLDVLK